MPIVSLKSGTKSRSLLVGNTAFDPLASGRALFGGGYSGANTNVIQYVEIQTTGNATDFGDLTVARRFPTACSSSTRGVFAGGYASANSAVIDYVTIASAGNATSFGTLLVGGYRKGGCSNST